jgi:hypothetical protein
MKLNYFAILMLMFIVSAELTSCDPGVSYDKIIQNDSDYDFILSVHGGFSYFYDTNSFYINKHSEVVIMTTGGLGQTFQYDDCNIYADSLTSIIVNNDSLKIKPDISDPSNWIFKILKETYKSGGTCECRLIISDDQIQ